MVANFKTAIIYHRILTLENVGRYCRYCGKLLQHFYNIGPWFLCKIDCFVHHSSLVLGQSKLQGIPQNEYSANA